MNKYEEDWDEMAAQRKLDDLRDLDLNLYAMKPKKRKSLFQRLFGWLWTDNPDAPSITKPTTAKDFPKFKEGL
ncbi:MAG: hypothetical protein K9N51_02335 [Candidatus Pacebacteria bacterium]|nr:hypothetical protein [Candidatus Paceibacterota bacterium]